MMLKCLPALAVLLALGAGCGGTRRGFATDPNLEGLALSGADSWESIQDVLRRKGYRLDRVDRDAGVITTFPEMSQHFFELWRKDTATRTDFWESTLNPMRRWVEVRAAPNSPGGLEVIVHKERLSTLDRQFNSTAVAYQFFGHELPSTTGKPRVEPEDDRWIDCGRDPALEAYLLGQMVRAASGQV